MLIDTVKTSLRISHNRLDDELNRHILACLDDMKRVGVAVPENIESVSDDRLLSAAVLLYCKAQNDFLGKGDSFKKGYENLRDALSLSGDYIESGDSDV